MLPSCTQVVHQLSGEFRFPFVFLWTWLMKRPGCPHCKLTDQKSREHSGLLFFPLQTGHTIYKSTCVVPVLSLICSYKTVAHFPRAFYLILTNTFRFGPPCPHTGSATRVLELETPPFDMGPTIITKVKGGPIETCLLRVALFLIHLKWVLLLSIA